jgi:uncharacterized protein YndB with AHSA1/START domain
MMTMTTQQDRTFEMTLEIDAPVEAVWQALTDAEDLVRWFATNARIEPRVGGKWRISWDGRWPWDTEIAVFEPNRHLRLVDRQGRPYDADGKATLDGLAPMELALDWHLEGHGGRTVLRLVHSGFGRGGAWDDEYDGVSVGWRLELRGLRHYLEHHRGRHRSVAWARATTPEATAGLWRRLAGPGGLLRAGRLDGTREGDPYSAVLATGDTMHGVVVAAIPHRAWQVTVEPLNDALFRVWIDRIAGVSSVNAWLTTYGLPAETASGFEQRLDAEIARILSATPAALG